MALTASSFVSKVGNLPIKRTCASERRCKTRTTLCCSASNAVGCETSTTLCCSERTVVEFSSVTVRVLQCNRYTVWSDFDVLMVHNAGVQILILLSIKSNYACISRGRAKKKLGAAAICQGTSVRHTFASGCYASSQSCAVYRVGRGSTELSDDWGRLFHLASLPDCLWHMASTHGDILVCSNSGGVVCRLVSYSKAHTKITPLGCCVGNEDGEPVIEERKIRIMTKPAIVGGMFLEGARVYPEITPATANNPFSLPNSGLLFSTVANTSCAARACLC